MTDPLQSIQSNTLRQKQKFIASVLDLTPRLLYKIDDYKTMRSLIFQNVQLSVKNRFPLYNNKYILDVLDVLYLGPLLNDYSALKLAIMTGKSVGRKLKGRFVLKDAASLKVLSRGKKQTIITVPYMTDKGTFITNGSLYALLNIMRLLPGVYTKKNTDNLISAQFNVKKGTGAGFNMRFVPSSGLFYINRGTANAPAYTVMRDLGVPLLALREAWGLLLYNKNREYGSSLRARIAANRIYNYS